MVLAAFFVEYFPRSLKLLACLLMLNNDMEVQERDATKLHLYSASGSQIIFVSMYFYCKNNSRRFLNFNCLLSLTCFY